MERSVILSGECLIGDAERVQEAITNWATGRSTKNPSRRGALPQRHNI